MRAGLRWKAARCRRWRDDPTDSSPTEALARMGTDASRISPALRSVIDEEIERYGVPWRISVRWTGNPDYVVFHTGPPFTSTVIRLGD